MALPEVRLPARTDHFTRGRSYRIRAVIIHATAGKDSLNWLRWQSNPPVSCHILISRNGTRYRIVDDWDVAWHAGRSTLTLPGLASLNPNLFTLGVELENLNDSKEQYPDAQLDALGATLSQWYRTYGRLLWFYHSDVDSSKRDPAGLDYTTVCRYFLRYSTGL